MLFPATPMGQLPVLEVDGMQMFQSLSIGRFLANKFNLAGTTPVEKCQADMIVECCKDFYDCELFIFNGSLFLFVFRNNLALMSVVMINTLTTNFQ